MLSSLLIYLTDSININVFSIKFDFNIDDIIFTNLMFLVLKSLLKYFTSAIKIQIYIEFNNFYRNFKFLQFQIMNPIKIYQIIIIIYKINLNQFFTIYLLLCYFLYIKF